MGVRGHGLPRTDVLPGLPLALGVDTAVPSPPAPAHPPVEVLTCRDQEPAATGVGPGRSLPPPFPVQLLCPPAPVSLLGEQWRGPCP